MNKAMLKSDATIQNLKMDCTKLQAENEKLAENIKELNADLSEYADTNTELVNIKGKLQSRVDELEEDKVIAERLAIAICEGFLAYNGGVKPIDLIIRTLKNLKGE